MTAKLRIFIADDHAIIRVGLKSLIDGEPNMTLVGEACNGVEAVSRASSLQPDIVVLDISMPQMTGAQTASRLRAACPAAKILALSIHEDGDYLREVLEAGASGYVLKRSAAEELVRAIHIVAVGGTYVAPEIGAEFVRAFGRPQNNGRPATGLGLSVQETRVLRLIAEGHNVRDVAIALEIGARTVETYKARSMEKLNLRSRVDLIQHAKKAGWFNS